METLLFGIAGTVLGIGVLALHCFAPGKLGKLQAFREQYGEKTGKIIHLVFYGIVPLIIGGICLGKTFMK